MNREIRNTMKSIGWKEKKAQEKKIKKEVGYKVGEGPGRFYKECYARKERREKEGTKLAGKDC